jgi:predicted PurR-regulated permease PerM
MNLKLTPARLLAVAVIAVSVWVMHDFIEALLVACIAAITSWPLYERWMARRPRGVGRRTASAAFTAAITIFVLAPMVFACFALIHEANALVMDLAAADRRGLTVPPWLTQLPTLGPWLAARWGAPLGRPGALLNLTQQTDPAALLGWVQALGQFTLRHLLTVGFSVLLLGFLYQEGAALACELKAALRRGIGASAERYLGVATRAVRAAVNSMLAVGLFDAGMSALVFALIGAPRALVWAAIAGALAAVPFLGYVAVAALALSLAVKGAATPALMTLVLGSLVLLSGDKLVRPLVARGGIQLPFVWVLIGCVGGFSTIGLAGVVIGPVALSLAGELWNQELRQRACHE